MNQEIEKICEYCGKLLVAKRTFQKYHISCGNKLNRDRINASNKKTRTERKEAKERIFNKIK